MTALNGQARATDIQPPPHDADAERGCLCAALSDSELRRIVLNRLDVDDYYNHVHGAIHRAIRDLEEAGRPVDPVTIGDALRDVDDVVPALFGVIEAHYPTITQAEEHARIVLRHAALRRFIRYARDIHRESIDPAADAEDLARRYGLEHLLAGDGASCGIPLPDLIVAHPRLRTPVIDGLLRDAETANIVGASKTAKSWLVHDLCLSVATGSPWLGRQTAGGDVLLIDAELHPETLAHRLRDVAAARGMRVEDASRVRVETLRGRWQDIHTLAARIGRTSPPPRLIVLDALYRLLPPGTSENDNAAMTAVYNAVDRLAQQLGCAIIVVHHTSKGDQSGRSVTDVGSGAGSASRAVDCHIVLRPHEQDGAVALEAVVRSWPQPEPVVLRWSHPVWCLADDLDPAALKRPRTRHEEGQAARDRKGCQEITDTLQEHGPCTERQLREHTGMGQSRLIRLLAMLRQGGQLATTETTIRGNPASEHSLTKPPTRGRGT